MSSIMGSHLKALQPCCSWCCRLFAMVSSPGLETPSLHSVGVGVSPHQDSVSVAENGSVQASTAHCASQSVSSSFPRARPGTAPGTKACFLSCLQLFKVFCCSCPVQFAVC